MKKIRYDMKGQTLVTLLFFMVISVTIVSAAVVAISTNATSGSRQAISEESYYLTETGIENALLLLLRDPAYIGETLTLPEGEVTVTVSGEDTKTVTAVGKTGAHQRKIEVTADYINDILTVTSWKETLL